jgi:hypothetical protein
MVFVFILIDRSLVISGAEESLPSFSEGQIDGIIEDFRQIVPNDFEDLGDGGESLGVKRVLADIITALTDSSDELVTLLLCIIGIAMISSLASSFDSETSHNAHRAIGLV